MSGSVRSIPDATVARLPLYLRALAELAEGGTVTVSSEGLAHAAGVNSAQVRKDLSFLGSHGTRGVGYVVDELTGHIAGVLGLTTDWAVVLVGVGNLGRALASYGGFSQRGFRIVAAVDSDPAAVGDEVAGIPVQPADRLPEIVEEAGVSIAVLAVPAEAAQRVTDVLVAAGVEAILNFAPAHLEVPPHVTVRKVDLSTELQILAYYTAQKVGSRGTG